MTAALNELKPVLVFDSGIGGLTVLREARVLMPERGFIYVADDAGFPYGGWEEQALKERIIALFTGVGCLPEASVNLRVPRYFH